MKKIYKIAHISDTHIRNQKYHDEYELVFEEIYRRQREQKVDYIVHCGDIAHTKTQISPEYVLLCSDFLSNQADIAPLYILPGNHDGNLKNLERMDAITPIVKNLQHPNIHYSRKSVVYHLNSDIDLYTWSLFDSGNWPQIQDKTKINICTYHGLVEGSKTDVGYELQHADLSVRDFRDFDYVMLGDIHRSNQILDFPAGRVRYAGSTVQQNFGELDDKGFLVWEIENKQNFSVKHEIIRNPKPFINVYLTGSGQIPSGVEIKPNGRVRLLSDVSLSVDRIRNLTDHVQAIYEPEYVRFVNNHNKQEIKLKQRDNVENLRDIEVQNKLFKQYFEESNSEEDLFKKILELNKKYNDVCNQEEENYRNINWEILELKWDNLYNYGFNNKIDFEKLSGVVGVFGKNYSGKSSIFDSLLLTMFNADSKTTRKNVDYINENKDTGKCSVKIRIGDKILHILRTLEKKELKKGQDGKKSDASVKVKFRLLDAKTGELIATKTKDKRNETDVEIQKYIGTIEHFLLSSMSAQNDALRFLDLKSTKRKETIAKFLDLELFEKKYLLAKEDMRSLDLSIKEKGEINYPLEIKLLETKLEKNDLNIQQQKQKCDELKVEIQSWKDEIDKLNKELSKDIKFIKIEQVMKEKEQTEQSLKSYEKKRTELEREFIDLERQLGIYEEILEGIDIDDLKKNKKEIRLKQEEYDKIINKVKQEEIKERMMKKKTLLLNDVPCGEEFSHCKFIKDAWAALEDLDTLKQTLDLLHSQQEEMSKEDYKSREEQYEYYINEFEKAKRKYDKIKSDISKNKLLMKNVLLEQEKKTHELEKLLKKERQYEQTKDLQDNFHNYEMEKYQYEGYLKGSEKRLVKEEATYLNLYTQKGTLERELQFYKEDWEEYKDELLEYGALEAFCKACHNNGIPYSIIRNKLPIINLEIAKILNKIVDFEIFLDAEEKKLNVYIQHPKYNPRPIEGCSGAEKSFAAMALRLALLNISSLPRSDIFILDEPGTSLDENNLEGFIRILDILKENFKIVFLVSHMESLKDVSDTIIEIERTNHGAKVRI